MFPLEWPGDAARYRPFIRLNAVVAHGRRSLDFGVLLLRTERVKWGLSAVFSG